MRIIDVHMTSDVDNNNNKKTITKKNDIFQLIITIIITRIKKTNKEKKQ